MLIKVHSCTYVFITEGLYKPEMTDKLNDLAGRMGKAPKGLGKGATLLAAAVAGDVLSQLLLSNEKFLNLLTKTLLLMNSAASIEKKIFKKE